MKSEDLELLPKSFTFKKNERLRSKKAIKALFASKSSGFTYPFKYLIFPNQSIKYHQVLISVPKKQFKKSVDRHLINRRIKEAYRLNKHILTCEIKYDIAFIYVAKEILSFTDIEKKVSLTLQQINKLKNETSTE